jgi:hypothetical protein
MAAAGGGGGNDWESGYNRAQMEENTAVENRKRQEAAAKCRAILAKFRVGDEVRYSIGANGTVDGVITQLIPGTCHAMVTLTETARGFQEGTTAVLDVRHLKLIQKRLANVLNNSARKHALENSFAKETGRDPNAFHHPLSIVREYAGLPRNRLNGISLRTKPNVKGNYSKNNITGEWIKKGSNPLTGIGNVFNSENNSPQQGPAGGAGGPAAGSRKTRRNKKTRRNRKTRR